jgi:hypothetical protein
MPFFITAWRKDGMTGKWRWLGAAVNKGSNELVFIEAVHQNKNLIIQKNSAQGDLS